MAYEREIKVTGDTESLDRAFEKSGKMMGDVIEDVDKKMDDMSSNASRGIERLTAKQQEQAMVTKELYEGLIKDSEKFNDSKKKQFDHVEREIKQINRAAKAEEVREKAKANTKFQAAKREAESSGSFSKGTKMDSAREEFNAEMSDIESRKNASDEQVRNLKSKLDIDRGEVEPPEESDGGGGRRGGGRAISRARQAFNTTAGAAGFGAVLTIGGFLGKAISEGIQLDTARARKRGGGFEGSGSIAGIKEADFIMYQQRVARSMGTGAFSGVRATNIGTMERATGMDLGSTVEFGKNLRSEKEGRGITTMTQEMLAIMEKSDLYDIKKGDFTMTHELLSRANELNELQGSQTEEIDSRRSSEVIAMLAGLGGRFSDTRQVSTINSMNEAIKNPNNDFKRAFIMRTIKGMEGGEDFDLLDIQLAMEEGIFGKGMMKAIVGGAMDLGGGRVMQTNNIAQLLDITKSGAFSIREQFLADPTILDDVTNQEDIQRIIGDQNLVNKGKGGRGIGTAESWQAGFNTFMAEGGATAIATLDGLMGRDGAAKKLGEDIVNAIDEGFRKATGISKEKNPDEVFTLNEDEGIGLSNLFKDPMKSLKTIYHGANVLLEDTPEIDERQAMYYKNMTPEMHEFSQKNGNDLTSWMRTGETDNKQLQQILNVLIESLGEQKRKPVEANSDNESTE